MPGGSQYFFSLDKFPTSTSMQNFKVVALVVLEIKGVYNVHPPGPLRVAKSPVLLELKGNCTFFSRHQICVQHMGKHA